jgi:hypothetical protein
MRLLVRNALVILVLAAGAVLAVACPTCLLGSETIIQGAVRAVCPRTINLEEKWLVSSPDTHCIYTCSASSTDGTFTPTNCGPTFVNLNGVLVSVTSNLQATFHPTDCSTHYIQLVTRVVEADGTIMTYNGGNVGYSCTTYGSGGVQHNCL